MADALDAFMATAERIVYCSLATVEAGRVLASCTLYGVPATGWSAGSGAARRR